jgi:hypothetical protein
MCFKHTHTNPFLKPLNGFTFSGKVQRTYVDEPVTLLTFEQSYHFPLSKEELITLGVATNFSFTSFMIPYITEGTADVAVIYCLAFRLVLSLSFTKCSLIS